MMTQETLLQSLELTVEQHLATAIRTFQNLDEHTLLAPSKTGGWSIAQCLDHLNGYGAHYLPEIDKARKKAIAKTNNSPYKGSWLGNYFTKAMDPATGNKMKAFKNHIPEKELDARKVVAEFIQQQELMLQYLAAAKSIDISSVSVPISIAKYIKINLGDTFRFVTMHNERHMQQALRNCP